MTQTFTDDVSINWYRTPIDRTELKALMQRSNLHGWVQTLGHLGLFFFTGACAYATYANISAENWHWNVPVLVAVLFVHGTIGPFMGLIAIHELQHRTVFRTRWLNEMFEVVYAFISWSDYIWYQRSHAIHHRATCHREHDGEVVLPVRFSLSRWRVWLGLLAWNPKTTWVKLKTIVRHAQGRVDGDWNQYVLPESDVRLRERHRNWARILLIGHGLLAAVFIVTGHWFLLVLFTIGTHYCAWFGFLCAVPQHYGLGSDLADFRLNTRTYTGSWIVGFYYWNMQYHLEHHMYPAVPFFALPKLRAALEPDLPTAQHGLRATWSEMLEIKSRSVADSTYTFVPALPQKDLHQVL